MSKVFEDFECTKLLLDIILNKDDLEIVEVIPQKVIKNLQGRSIQMDIYATDSNGKKYNIEIQRDDNGAVPKRARYNSSLLDANITEPGDTYQNLKETYIIFITENDVLKAGLPIYHIERVIEETGEPFCDEAHILYINSLIQDETALGKLMHDFNCKNASDMIYPVLAERVRYLKETERGINDMCEITDRIRNEGRNEGRKEGRKEGIQFIIKKLINDGTLSLEKAAEITNFPVEKIVSLTK